MNGTPKKSGSPETRSSWPDLEHKYGKLGNPAVLAAVVLGQSAARRHGRQSRDAGGADPAKLRR